MEKLENRLNHLRLKMEAKIRSSFAANGKVFRLEQLCDALTLGSFEKSCILFLLQSTIMPQHTTRAQLPPGLDRMCTVGSLVRSMNNAVTSGVFG